jgi:hypothetical protein
LNTLVMRALTLIALVAAALAIVGCGGSGRGKAERPPVTLTIAVQIGEDEVTSSPQKFGAGPITMIASNQTPAAQELTIDGPRVNRTVPVDPQDTATLKVALQPGEYTLETKTSQQIPPYALQVGAERASAQNRLLLP